LVGILDEASQATYGDSYCFLGRSVQKMVFVGDDKQLPPTVISQD
jgi:superfamily I DNA and/or RNA helicase